VTIHDTHPFADPHPDPVRRFRGRLGGAVTLWTTGSGPDRVGLTVSSLVVALGEPSHVIGLLDPDADLTETLRDTGRAVVQVLAWSDRALGEAFAGMAPAPGGPFRMADFEDTPWGPAASRTSRSPTTLPRAPWATAAGGGSRWCTRAIL
jgi:flavin reductase (DIM6/NTAB) family NADH-FMN oxidoreductase RutF